MWKKGRGLKTLQLQIGQWRNPVIKMKFTVYMECDRICQILNEKIKSRSVDITIWSVNIKLKNT